MSEDSLIAHERRWGRGVYVAVLVVAAVPVLAACLEGGERVRPLTPPAAEPSDANQGPGVDLGDVRVDPPLRPPDDPRVSPDTVQPETSAPDTDDSAVCALGTRRCEGDAALECRPDGWIVRLRCEGQESCVDGQCVCSPVCGDAECGADGCGGRCGTCDEGSDCVNGRCQCRADCGARVCGSDGCGGVCGECGPDAACNDAGRCVCVPRCDGRVCGGDGCGGSCGECPPGQQCTEAGRCSARPSVYRAVYIDDRWNGDCSPSNTPGADIDAVGLSSDTGQLISYFVAASRGAAISDCPNDHQDPAAAVGPPSSGLGSDYLSLQGGWVIGRFGQGVTIESGHLLTIWEFDNPLLGASPEPFSVYLARNMACAGRADRYTSCLTLLSDTAFGRTDITVPLSAF